MIGTVYDYLMATTIVGVIFVAAVVVVPNASYTNLLYVDQQQLRNTALETLKAILLDTGYPADWGSQKPFDQNSVKRFGLAHSGTSTFYLLDLEKVQRLVSDNPAGNIDYELIRERLGLEGYGFNIKIKPPFKVSIGSVNQSDNFIFDITVAMNDGRPLPNALVTGTIFYVLKISGQKNNFFYDSLIAQNTDELGECTLEYGFPADCRGYILVLKVTVADVATLTVPYLKGMSQNVAAVSLIGDEITMHIPENQTGFNPPRSAERRIYNITCVTEDDVWNVFNGLDEPVGDTHITWGEGYYYWQRTFPGLSYEEPLFMIFNIWVPVGAGGGGRQLVLFATSPLLNIQSGLLELGGSSAHTSSGAVKLSRSVNIAGMTYIFELVLWKEL
jgi:hypothetical protein